ncbi:hypothetical protein C1H46_045914 [Malus baccata]|uniref:Uncharacterized protein n=1 Tax=Malus baccata TaxID=106549 RepID=A0A540K2N6_MALBA|nr:hypothetical protein C1H46_045914 [Malus baccata]
MATTQFQKLYHIKVTFFIKLPIRNQAEVDNGQKEIQSTKYNQYHQSKLGAKGEGSTM